MLCVCGRREQMNVAKKRLTIICLKQCPFSLRTHTHTHTHTWSLNHFVAFFHAQMGYNSSFFLLWLFVFSAHINLSPSLSLSFSRSHLVVFSLLLIWIWARGDGYIGILVRLRVEFQMDVWYLIWLFQDFFSFSG
jgi:hypothetical protein